MLYIPLYGTYLGTPYLFRNGVPVRTTYTPTYALTKLNILRLVYSECSRPAAAIQVPRTRAKRDYWDIFSFFHRHQRMYPQRLQHRSIDYEHPHHRSPRTSIQRRTEYSSVFTFLKFVHRHDHDNLCPTTALHYSTFQTKTRRGRVTVAHCYSHFNL